MTYFSVVPIFGALTHKDKINENDEDYKNSGEGFQLEGIWDLTPGSFCAPRTVMITTIILEIVVRIRGNRTLTSPFFYTCDRSVHTLNEYSSWMKILIIIRNCKKEFRKIWSKLWKAFQIFQNRKMLIHGLFTDSFVNRGVFRLQR